MLKERDWQKTVEQAARLLGWLVYHTRRSDGSQPGYPDLTLVRAPRVVFVELKTETGRQTPDQRLWETRLRACPSIEFYLWRPSHWPEVERVLAR